MKNILTIILLLISTQAVSQEFITEEEFDVAITGTSAFGENESIVVIEVWAEFNKDNAFSDWKLPKIQRPTPTPRPAAPSIPFPTIQFLISFKTLFNLFIIYYLS